MHLTVRQSPVPCGQFDSAASIGDQNRAETRIEGVEGTESYALIRRQTGHQHLSNPQFAQSTDSAGLAKWQVVPISNTCLSPDH